MRASGNVFSTLIIVQLQCSHINLGIGFGDNRIPQTELSSLPDWGIAQKWIRECIDTHRGCSVACGGGGGYESGASLSQMPTRVIDVGLSHGEEPRLVECKTGTAEYVTLSHCWGNVQPLRTLLSNMEQHLDSIPLESMPKTFQDAVIATRELSFRYLWIDSLCIVQDSSEDWEVECSKMASIYRNSSLTICGTMAYNSASGFLNTKICPEPRPHLWEYTNTKDTDYKRATLTYYPPSDGGLGHSPSANYPDGNHLTKEERKSPLQHRGWILQEYLLSTRVLFFGLYRMYWECTMCIKFEDFQLWYEGSEERFRQLNGMRRLRLHGSIDKFNISSFQMISPTELSRRWRVVVEDFTQRYLSKSDDKLPAISGIAKWIFSGHGENYLAGYPKDALHEGLAWSIYPVGRDTQQRPSMRPRQTWNWVLDKSNYPANIQKHPLPADRAPSWSWASTDYPVDFTASREDIGPERAGKDAEARRKAFHTKLALMSAQNRILIQSTNVKLNGDDPFGRVKSGSIKLKGKVKTGLIVRVANNRGRSWLYVVDPISGGETAKFYPDDPPWDLYAKKAEEIRDGTDEPGMAASSVRLPAVSFGDDLSAAEATKPVRSSSLTLPQEIKCLCIDYFENINGWAAIAVEELSLGDPKRGTHRWEWNSLHVAFRRIGLVEYPGGIDSVLDWFKDCPWRQIELF